MPTRVDQYRELLTEFHKTFKVPVCRTWAETDFSNYKLRYNLIAEEYKEYRIAENRVDILDALGDLLYVTAGTWITTGIFPAEVMGNNPPARSELKLDLLPQVTGMLLELSKEKPCYHGLISVTTPLYWRLEAAAYMLGVNLLEVVQRIHKSNMTKLWPEDVLKAKWPDLSSSHIAENTAKGYIVKRISDGKVIKSPTYQPVDLTDL